MGETKYKLGIYDGRKYVPFSGEVYTDFRVDMDRSQKFNIEYLLRGGMEILIYSGMEDYICNYMSSQVWLRKLDWPYNREWRATKEDEWVLDGQVGGYYTKYRNLGHLKIKGAGHLVPMNQPSRALNMIMRFVHVRNELFDYKAS